MLLPVLRVMKPIAEHYRFLTVRHQDSLWKRHRLETKGSQQQLMQNIQPLDLLLDQRKEHWLMHCRFVLEQTADASLQRRTRKNNNSHCNER